MAQLHQDIRQWFYYPIVMPIDKDGHRMVNYIGMLESFFRSYQIHLSID